MSSTTTKDLRLSQPKVGMNSTGEPSSPVLVHQSSRGDQGNVITFEIPGVDPETVDVQCENNHLVVSCHKGAATIPVDPTTDVAKITADIKWGILTVTVPAPAAPPARAIKVNLHDTVKKPETKPAHKPATKEFTTV
jgi:HSP20 family molecular chaperone IbpA